MSSGGQTPVTQQTQQTRDPWAPSQIGLQTAMNQAMFLNNNDIGYQPYAGSTQAAIDPTLGAGLASMANTYAANLGGSAGVNAGRTLGTNMIQNEGLSGRLQSLYDQAQGQQNPFLQNILDTSNRRIGDRINAGMSGAGRYGSGQHTDVMARALAESADPILAQDYSQRQQMMQQIATGGLERAGQWAQLMPTLDQAQLAPAQGLANIGQFNQERAQRTIDDQIKLYNAQQARPWEQIARLNAIYGQAGALGGSQFGTQTTPINQPSTMQKLFGGAAAGAGIGGSFGGPLGAGVGAAAGGLLGLL